MAGKKAKVHGDMLVGGNAKTTVEAMVNEKGYMNDRFGNTIYITDSKENQERLKKKLAKKPAKKKVVKKAVKKTTKKVAKKTTKKVVKKKTTKKKSKK